MNLSEVFIKRPIATSLLMLGIAVLASSRIARCRSAICRTSTFRR